MVYRNWRQPQAKRDQSSKKRSKHQAKHSDDMKQMKKDENTLKRKKKRLTIDWFFRPQGD